MSGILGQAIPPGTYGIAQAPAPDPSAGVGATNQYFGPPGQEYPQAQAPAQSPTSFLSTFLPWIMDNYKPPQGTTDQAGALGTTAGAGNGFDMDALIKQFTDHPMGAPFGTQTPNPNQPNPALAPNAVPPGIPGANVGYGLNALGGQASAPTLPGQPNPMWGGVDQFGNPLFGSQGAQGLGEGGPSSGVNPGAGSGSAGMG